jgi:hypothetical protein
MYSIREFLQISRHFQDDKAGGLEGMKFPFEE